MERGLRAKLSSVKPPGAILPSEPSYPIISAFNVAGTLWRVSMVYTPSKSVVTPTVVPGNHTFTKGSGSPVDASLTVPLTFVVWAMAAVLISSRDNM